MDNVYEVIIERKVVNRFLVEARTQHEAAMAVGILMGQGEPFAKSHEQETDRKMLAPTKIEGQTVRDFMESLESGKTDVHAFFEGAVPLAAATAQELDLKPTTASGETP